MLVGFWPSVPAPFNVEQVPYDFIIVDNDLLQAIPQRRQTPIVMLTGDDCEAEAWRAGIKAFLRKPEGIDELS